VRTKILIDQNLGYDICPSLSFFVTGIKSMNFKSTGRRDLNIKYANFDQLKRWECHAYEYNNMNACNAITNAKTMNIYWLGNKLIGITGEEKLSITVKLVKTTLQESKHMSITFTVVKINIRKKILSITFTGVMTNIWKEILSITFAGVKTNIRKGAVIWEMKRLYMMVVERMR